jgi:hypothetical protein
MLSGRAPPERLSPSTSWRGKRRPAKRAASRPSPSASGRLELRSKAPEAVKILLADGVAVRVYHRVTTGSSGSPLRSLTVEQDAFFPFLT